MIVNTPLFFLCHLHEVKGIEQLVGLHCTNNCFKNWEDQHLRIFYFAKTF